ncbi:hypothetical protein [Psychromonas ossibalaenae]|uniref:hypothetical protein n=1 Tax=Psychromonas ossibalaenae TaxID=444922 RepID=UPI0003744749|nr:hypothetical protein [Psychromonas ossibalaenae]
MNNFLNAVFIFSKGIFISLLSSVVEFFILRKTNHLTKACTVEDSEADLQSEQWSALWSSASCLLPCTNRQYAQHSDFILKRKAQNAFYVNLHLQQTISALSFIVSVCFINIIKICQYSILEKSDFIFKIITIPRKHSRFQAAVFFFALRKIKEVPM